MPVYTVVGKLTDDESWFLPTGAYRGKREDMVPDGGWGHICQAANSRAAKARAVFWYASYAAGRAQFELEIRRQGQDVPQPAPRRGRWPWSRRKAEQRPSESLGIYPII